MAQNFDLTQTGSELQERIDQVFPNRDNIAAESERAVMKESDLQTQIDNTAQLRHLTQAEYDALTEEEKMNGTYYFIEE